MRRFLLILTLLLLPVCAAESAAMPTLPPMEILPPEVPEPIRILISAAGDCTLGGEVQTGIDKRFAKRFDSSGADYFLKSVRGIFEADDLTLVNLEGPLTEVKKHADKKYVMRGRPEYVSILSGSSVEIANLANNHTRDYREQGYQDTLSALESAGIRACGGELACITDVNGVKVGFLGYEKWNHTAKDAVSGVRELRPECDILIVSVHWGEEYHYSPEKAQTELGHALIDAGADLVIGTHPHVIQGVEQYKGKYIAYSLGNFCFGGNTNPDDKDCYIFQQAFDITDEAVSDGGIRIIPCSISSSDSTNNYQPAPLTGSRAEKLLGRILDLSVGMESAVWLNDDPTPKD